MEEGGANHPCVHGMGGCAFVVEGGNLARGEVEEGASLGKGRYRLWRLRRSCGIHDGVDAIIDEAVGGDEEEGRSSGGGDDVDDTTTDALSKLSGLPPGFRPGDERELEEAVGAFVFGLEEERGAVGGPHDSAGTAVPGVLVVVKVHRCCGILDAAGEAGDSAKSIPVAFVAVFFHLEDGNRLAIW